MRKSKKWAIDYLERSLPAEQLVVYRLKMRGLTNAQIAEEVGIRPETIGHLLNLCSINLRTRIKQSPRVKDPFWLKKHQYKKKNKEENVEDCSLNIKESDIHKSDVN